MRREDAPITVVKRRSATPEPSRSPVVSCVITRMQGPATMEKQTREFRGPNALTAAYSWMVSRSVTFPRSSAGDLHSLQIRWANGVEFVGVMDAKHHGQSDHQLSPCERVRDFLAASFPLESQWRDLQTKIRETCDLNG